MATTKTTTVVVNNVTMTAGAGNTNHDITIDTGYGGMVALKLTNGATGPTVAAQIQTQQSNDGTNFFNYGGALQGSTANNDVESWAIEIPIGVKRLRFVIGSTTGQNVTGRVEVTNTTAV